MPFLIVLAILGLIASAVVHVSTFFTDRLAMDGGTWVLHIGVFVVWFPAVALQAAQANADKAKRDRKAGQQSCGGGAQTGQAAEASGGGGKNADGDDIMRHAPRWLAALAAVCFVYAIVNFLVFFFLIREGEPRIRDGQYLLMEKGRVIRPLTEEEFHQKNRYKTRGFSGHWMLFYAAAATLLYAKARQRREERPAPPPPPPAHVQPAVVRYVLYPKPLLLPWAHEGLRMLIASGGFIGAIVAVSLVARLVAGRDAAGSPWFPAIAIAAALAGFTLPPYLFGRLVPARCPRCNGRAYFRHAPKGGYACADCGHVHPPSHR